MRTLRGRSMRRSCITGALISVCLVVGGLPVLAQEASPGPTGSLDLGDRTLVLATTTDMVELQDSTQTQDGDILQARDLVWQYQFHATDPRLASMLRSLRPRVSSKVGPAITPRPVHG